MVWKKGAGVGLSVILLAFLTLFESEVVSPGIALGQQPYPPPSRNLSPLEEDIRLYQAMLARKLDPQMRRSLEEKLAIAQRLATQAAMGTENPVPKKHLGVYISDVTNPPPRLGIIEGQGQTIRPSEARISNRWIGKVGNGYVVVFAGAPTEDPTQGIIYVMRVSDEDGTHWERILPPVQTGMLSIVEEGKGYLLLRSAKGLRLRFDVRTLGFTEIIDQNGRIIQTTPIPTVVGTPAIPYPYP